MKRKLILLSLLLLTITLCACANQTKHTNDIYTKIHDKFYEIGSYSAKCNITAFNSESKNTYDCKVDYNSNDSSFKVTTDDMIITLLKDKTTVTRGTNTIESIASPTDMYIFVNTFFKSYYEAEDTTVSVNADNNSDTTLLECSVINPTEFADKMKLTIDNKTILPVNMQVIDKNGRICTEIKFENFDFI